MRNLSSSSSSAILASAIICSVSSLQLHLQCLSISIISIGVNLLHVADGTCNSAQSTDCLQAAAEGQLDQLPGGGQCLVKQYVQYTHLCTVSNYLPSVDYCCCLHETRLLCCRYHQDWYHFRCMESEDELEIANKDASSYVLTSVDMPLLNLLPAILCPMAAIAICVVCWTKCWCYRYDTDSSSSSSSAADGNVSSSSSCCCCCCCGEPSDDDDQKSKSKSKKKISRSRDFRFRDDEAAAPLSSIAERQQPPPSSVQYGLLRTIHSVPYNCSATAAGGDSPCTSGGGQDVSSPSAASCKCLCNGGSTSTRPSAPSVVIADDLFTSGLPPDFGSISASGLVALRPEVARGRHVCLRRLRGHPFPDAADLTPKQQQQQHVYCGACAAGPCEQAHFRCCSGGGAAVETLPMVRLTHAHGSAAACVTCVNGYPPAYEAIHCQNDLQFS